MRQSRLIPKVCAAAVFLIIAVIISAPVTSVVLNRIFGGGVVEFGTASAAEYLNNRPVQGNLSYIIGVTSDSSGDDGFTLKKGTYYYLVSVTGTNVKNESSEKVLMLRAPGNSNSYEDLNGLIRKGSSSEGALLISGVAKKASQNEKTIAEQLCKDNNLEEVTYIDYCVDCTRSVSSFTARFLLSLIFYAGFVISLLLSIQAVKKNRAFDDMEHRRAILQAQKDLKAASNDSNNTDAMFGDADRSYASSNTQRQGEGQSPTEIAQSLEQQSQYQNNQYQGAQQPQQFGSDDGFFGQQNNSDDKYGGFFGS